jgi:hypothetical protein
VGGEPDASLAPVPTTHRGLTYPLGRRVPAPGELVEIAPGVGWARLPVPGSLNHINVWALEDGEGVALVDTGLDIPSEDRQPLRLLILVDNAIAAPYRQKTYFHQADILLSLLHLFSCFSLCLHLTKPNDKCGWIFIILLL